MSDVPTSACVPEHDLDWFVDDLRLRGIRRIHVFGWRDLADSDAGGSEVHADEFMSRWAERGIEVLHRTSRAEGLPDVDRRNGYQLIRRGSRYTVFPRVIASEITRWMGSADAIVEIWNGVPWFSPVWSRRPKITILHHVHGPMWDQILPGPLAKFGSTLETRIAPPFYRRGLTVTPFEATRDELLALGFRPDRVVAVPNGANPMFSPGGDKTAHPSIIAVGRLAPVKRFDLVIDAAVEARRRFSGLQLSIVGEGRMRDQLQRKIDDVGGGNWIELLGWIDHHSLIDHYRRSWLVVSGSLAEGWGLSLTEAAACGTPAVATDINGHRSSVIAERTGRLVSEDRLGSAIGDLLADDQLRQSFATAALERTQTLTWEASALGVTRCLHAEVLRCAAKPS